LRKDKKVKEWMTKNNFSDDLFKDDVADRMNLEAEQEDSDLINEDILTEYLNFRLDEFSQNPSGSQWDNEVKDCT
jgi:hypothetical protein